jgi:hypothetical protein
LEKKNKNWVNAKTRAAFAQLELPPAAQATNDNLANLFETPVLFFVASALFVSAGIPVTDDVVTLAFIFVAARALHSLVQISLGPISVRFALFLISILSLAKIWWDLYVGIQQIA